MSEPEHIPQSFPFSNEEKSWQEHRWAEAQKVPERIEDTAKFLATMISLSLTLALTLVEKPIAVPKGAFPTVLVALACWMLSILLAFLVLMPRHYRHVPDSTEDYRRIAQAGGELQVWPPHFLRHSVFGRLCAVLFGIGVWGGIGRCPLDLLFTKTQRKGVVLHSKALCVPASLRSNLKSISCFSSFFLRVSYVYLNNSMN